MRLEHKYRPGAGGGVRPALVRVPDLTLAGELVVRRECRGGVLVLSLSGELDRATSALLERELDGAQAVGTTRVIVDLTGLDLIDSSGMNTLANARDRALQSGRQLSLRPGSGVIGRALELTNDAGLRSSEDLPGAGDLSTTTSRTPAARADVDHTGPKVIGPGAPPTGSPIGSGRERRTSSPGRRSRRAILQARFGPTTTRRRHGVPKE